MRRKDFGALILKGWILAIGWRACYIVIRSRVRVLRVCVCARACLRYWLQGSTREFRHGSAKQVLLDSRVDLD